jgi:hypothetical protein
MRPPQGGGILYEQNLQRKPQHQASFMTCT